MTTFTINSPQAVKRWSSALALDTDKMSYFTKFIGEGENNIIERKAGLEDDAGDEIKFDLSMRLRGGMVFGDNIVEGTEESLTFYQDSVKIDQARKGAAGGGRMTRKRTLHDLRKITKDRTAEFLAEWFDEGLFIYLSGDASFTQVNQDTKWTGAHAGNAITAPDADHIMYAGAATSKATLVAGDKMTVQFLERVAVKPRMMNAVNPDVVRMGAVTYEGTKNFVVLMSPWQTYQLRTETGDLSWTKIQQALATYEGRNSPICKGGLGRISGLVLHEHENVRRFSDYGAGSNIAAARALLLGRQAGVVAYGAAGRGTRMSWFEKEYDAGNQVAIYAGMIVGMKKTTFNGYDFGVVALDSAAAAP